MFDASVMGGTERSEAQTENVAVVGAVADQERAIGFIGQLRLGLVEPQCTPVPPTLSQTQT